MNQANIDYLYQVFTPVPDRSSSSRGDSGASEFGVHLDHATTPVFDVVHSPPRDTTRTSAAPLSNTSRSQQYESATSSTGDRPQSNLADASETNTSSGATEQECPSCMDSAQTMQEPDQPDDDDQDANDSTSDEVATEAAAANGSQPKQAPDATPDHHQKHVQNEAQPGVTIAALEAPTAQTNTELNASQGNTAVFDPSIAVADNLQAAANKSDNATTGEAPHDDSAKAGKLKESARATEEGTISPGQTDVDQRAGAKTTSETRADVTLPTAPVVASAEDVSGSAAKRRSKAASDADAGFNAADNNKSENSSSIPGTNNGTASTSTTFAIANGVLANNVDVAAGGVKTDSDKDPSAKPVGAKSETAVGPLGRALRSAVDLTRGTKAGAAADTVQVDPARFIGRVSRAIQTANERGGDLQLRLAPPELGSLKIQLSVKDGVMSAALEADNATARRLLLDHLPALRDRLAEQNIRIERFDVDVRQENNNGQANSRGSNQNPYQQQPDQPQPRRGVPSARPLTEIPLPDRAAGAPSISSTGINLVI